MSNATKDSYHHGALREAMVDAAVAAIADKGMAAVSIRAVASVVGVTHGAARHHFGTKSGLMTAVAIEGYRRLSERLEESRLDGGFGTIGIEYLRFAQDNPGYYEAMYQPNALDQDNSELIELQQRTAQLLFEVAGEHVGTSASEAREIGVAAWAVTHGLALLWRNGNLPEDEGQLIELAKRMTDMLFLSNPALLATR